MKESPNLPTEHLTFKFPTLISEAAALQNDVVFCGKVMTRQKQTEQGHMARPNSFSKHDRSVNRYQLWGSLQLPGTGYSRLRRSGSTRRRCFNGLFGEVKFPVQMDLSDMRKRQWAMPPPELAAVSDGEKKEWKWHLIRSLKRKGWQWLNALSTTSFDF